jgi:ATP-dependent Clp protease ATP-binding subunit ClpB
MKAALPDAETIGRLKGLAGHLRGHIIGQRAVIPPVAEALMDGELGLTDPGRPKGTFLFLGPTGVGKTELCLAFTRYLFGSDPGRNLIRLDMSEFQNQESVGILLGRSESEEGVLAKRIDAAGGSGTLLLDEIEKAHPRVLDLLLQVLDAARISMANGRTLDLSNFYVVCTSNIAAHAILDARHSKRSTLVRFIETQAQAQLRPEIFARFQSVSVFDRLGYEEQIAIAKLMLERELGRLTKSLGIDPITYDGRVPATLAADGFHPRLGARPMRHSIEQSLRATIRDALLSGQTESGHLATSSSGSLQLRPKHNESHPDIPSSKETLELAAI